MQALVIDEDPQARLFISQVLQNEGWQVTQANSAETILSLFHNQNWTAVFCEVQLTGADAYSLLKQFKNALPQTKVILMTARGSGAGALDATAFGAYDYILKPLTAEGLQSLSKALGQQLKKTPYQRSFSTKTPCYKSDISLVGHSDVFIQLMKQVGRVAVTDLPILLTGESGTGKELIASALHQRSKHAQNSFVPVNCGAIPSELIESELFGHIRGSFTGADRDRRGLWEEADGGTIFLDEITETTPSFQVKLLRTIQEGEIRRVGSNQTQKLNVRIIAASNRDVECEVKAGRFRQDLFYRLNAVSLILPPLRERRADVLPLAKYFIERLPSLTSSVSFSPEALSLLENYPWPGNIRELENAVVRSAALSEGKILAQHLPDQIKNYREPITDFETPFGAVHNRRQEVVPLAEMQARYVTWVLKHVRGNKQAAARLLSIDRTTLNRMIKRHKIEEGPETSFSPTPAWTN